jgi:hypothetical protein
VSAVSLVPPQLDGVDFRTFRGRADYADFARLITASSRGEGHDRVETAEGLASAYDHLERCDPAHDLVVAEVDGLPVAYSRVWWDQEPDGPRIYRHVCFVDPERGGRSPPGTTTHPRSSSRSGRTTATRERRLSLGQRATRRSPTRPRW